MNRFTIILIIRLKISNFGPESLDWTMTHTNRRIYIAIPLMDELEGLPELIRNLSNQDIDGFEVCFCVNQPDAWWDDPEKQDACERNLESLKFIYDHVDFPFTLIDRASRGLGWQGKQHGVGWARKVVMDAVASKASGNDIMITLDGDTAFDPSYFSSVKENFDSHPDAVGLSVPYYHRLTGREAEDRAILRYEIYMRSYAINLWRIENPYHFTALGSAMALPVHAYHRIGGMSPKKSGEDFYFLQKLVKFGRLLTWNKKKVFPAARFSDRVFFGTGPAMIRGAAGDWESYPVYHHSLFDDIRETYDAFSGLFQGDIPTPLDDFIMNNMNEKDIWAPLRANSKSRDRFIRACRDKIDGLRILQYLKYMQKVKGFRDEDCLREYFTNYSPEILAELNFPKKGFTFESLGVEDLNKLRDALTAIEETYQKTDHHA